MSAWKALILSYIFFFISLSSADDFSTLHDDISPVIVRFSAHGRIRLFKAIMKIYQNRERVLCTMPELDEMFALEGQMLESSHRSYRENNDNRYNFKIPLLEQPRVNSQNGYQLSSGSSNQYPKINRPSSQGSFQINMKKIEQDLIAYEARQKGFSEEVLDSLEKSNLTYEEQKAFLVAEKFEELDVYLQEKIIKEPHIVKNKEFAKVMDGHYRISCGLFKMPKEFRPHYDTYIDYADSFFPVTSKDELFLTPLGLERINTVVNQTSMARGATSPFIQERNCLLKFLGFKGRPFLYIDKKEFFVVDTLTQVTAPTRAGLLLCSNDEYEIDLIASLAVSNDAFEARLELLQQAYLYQHAEFRILVEAFPEYEVFVCALLRRLNRNPVGITHLFNILTLDLSGKPVQNLANYFRNAATTFS